MYQHVKITFNSAKYKNPLIKCVEQKDGRLLINLNFKKAPEELRPLRLYLD
jgi:hypothetical protein